MVARKLRRRKGAIASFLLRKVVGRWGLRSDPVRSEGVGSADSPLRERASPAPLGMAGMPRGPGAALERLAAAFALAGGALLMGVVGMTVASVVGRHFFGAPIPGDYEITELACGIAVFAFFPHCHVTGGHVVVDFFTGRLPARGRAALDALHGIAFTLVAGLLAWRLFVGAMHKLRDAETTLFLAIPMHWAYFAAVVAAGLLALTCLLVAYRHVRVLRG